MEHYARNVQRTLASVDDIAYRDGATWYETAHVLAIKLDPSDPARAAGVIAALSPQVSWERNVMLATRAYKDGLATGTLGANCRAADRILAGERPLDVLGGPKTRAFFTLIANPYDRETVCVDRHAFDIAAGQTGHAQRVKLTPKRYEEVANAYRKVARGTTLTPAQVQAITWVWWREHVKENRRGLS